MGRMEYLAMKTDPVAEELISSDFNELKLAANKLINDATKLGGLDSGTSFLKWVLHFLLLLNLHFAIGIERHELCKYHIVYNKLGRGWKMDCIHCSCSKAVLPPTLSRLAGDARIVDPSSGCGSKLLCKHLEEQLGWCFDMPPHRMLPTARPHPSHGWIPLIIHSEPRNIKHHRHYPSDSLPGLVAGASLCLATHSVQC
ncbi:hypothetical protein CRYUN_Cryun22dG0105500 [Craigia yunnanensis]